MGRIRVLAVVGLALLTGFFIGTWFGGSHIGVGRADSTGNGGGSISTSGWTYGFSADMNWTDAEGTWHEGGTPACLPPLSSVEGVRFAWVDVSIGSAGWRPVVWIDCQGVSTSPQIDCQLDSQVDCDRAVLGGSDIIAQAHAGTLTRIVVLGGRAPANTRHTELHGCFADGSYVLVDAIGPDREGAEFHLSLREQGRDDPVCLR